jgi:starch synthase
MGRNLSILMVSAEAHPLAKVGGLADVMGALPRALAKRGHDVRIALPFYKTINDKGLSISKIKGAATFDIALGEATIPAAAFSTRLPGSKIEVYLIGNDDLFGRDGIYSDPASGVPYDDNAERFVFFSRAVLRLLKLIDWEPDIIHCHDHQTGFIPAWIRHPAAQIEFSGHLRTAFTIHNLAYLGSYPKGLGYSAGFGEDMLRPMGGIEFHGEVNMMKAGIVFADTITAVSPTYSKEIQTPEFGYGLEGVLKARSEHLVGILNGADYSVWNPETDKHIPCKYSLDKPDGKQECRKQLIKRLNLSLGERTPLVGMISRLVAQKGFDIVTDVFDELMDLDLGFAILGLGDKKYHDMLSAAAARHPGKVSVNLAFDEEIAHQIEAGCDMFLMPSKYEPCGLNQMYSMKYGTIPIVRKTGGLADTVVDFDQEQESTGFVFEQYDSQGLLGAMGRARKAFGEREDWTGLVARAMSMDFSWDRAAGAYEEVYSATLDRKVVTAS